MPINLMVKENGAFIHIKAVGFVTSEDLIDMLRKIRSDDRVKPDHVTLFDALAISVEDLDLEDYNFADVLELEKDNKKKLIARKLAIVSRDMKVLVHAMRYQLLSAEIGEKTAIFNDVHEATLWLKL